MYYLGIDVHKTESIVAVVDEGGSLKEERRVSNADLDELARDYAGNAAALEVTGNYFTIYDTLDEELDVSVVNPLKTRWIAEANLKNDRVDAKSSPSCYELTWCPRVTFRPNRSGVAASWFGAGRNSSNNGPIVRTRSTPSSTTTGSRSTAARSVIKVGRRSKLSTCHARASC